MNDHGHRFPEGETRSAQISGHTVRLTASSSRVRTPTGVRYAWTDAPHCNLYSTSAFSFVQTDA